MMESSTRSPRPLRQGAQRRAGREEAALWGATPSGPGRGQARSPAALCWRPRAPGPPAGSGSPAAMPSPRGSLWPGEMASKPRQAHLRLHGTHRRCRVCLKATRRHLTLGFFRVGVLVQSSKAVCNNYPHLIVFSFGVCGGGLFQRNLIHKLFSGRHLHMGTSAWLGTWGCKPTTDSLHEFESSQSLR